MALAFLPFAFALAAFVIGIVVLARGRTGHGIAIVVLAVGCGVVGTTLGAVVGYRSVVRPAPAPETPVIYKLNQTFSVGYWTYTVNDASVERAIYDMDRMRLPNSGGWVVVDLTVRNDDRTSSTRPVVVLVDDRGREFSETETFSSNQLSQLEQLNPGVAKRGTLYFDAPQGHWRLKVSGGYESGKRALVELARPPVPEPTQ